MKKYLIAVALVLALVGTPVLAARDNTALINSLMQQVEQLMTMLRTLLAQQPTSTPAPISVPSSWKTYSGPIAGISFKYPNSLNPACAELQEPTVTVTSAGDSKIDSLGCLPASAERPIKSEKVTLNGINFCLSKGSDAGAGQLYRDYRYTTFKNNNYYTLGYVVHTSNGCGVFKNNNDVNSPSNDRYRACLSCQQKYDGVVIPMIQKSVSTLVFNSLPNNSQNCLGEGKMRGAGQQCCTGLILKPTTQSGTVGTCSKIGLSTSAGLTVSKILNSNGFVNGKKQNSQYSYDYISDVKIVDIDSDGLNEAFATYTTCGASCGRSVYIFRLNQNVVEAVSLPESMVAGAAQNIDSVVVSNGIISVTETDFGGTITNRYKVSVSNGRMVVLMQICPDSKTIDKMPTTDPNPNRIYSYFILNNLRRELTEFDSNWVAANCTVKENIVY